VARPAPGPELLCSSTQHRRLDRPLSTATQLGKGQKAVCGPRRWAL
jgi:hypothetical protein